MRFGKREMFFLLLLLAMPVAAYILIFEPRNQEIAAANAEIQEKRDKLRQLEAATMLQVDLREQIDRLTEAIHVFEKKLPPGDKFDVVLHEIQELAARRRMNIVRVERQRTVPQAEYVEAPIRLVITGDFDNFYRFMLDLERLSRITNVKDLKIEKLLNRRDGGDQMEADMRVSIFYENKPE